MHLPADPALASSDLLGGIWVRRGAGAAGGTRARAMAATASRIAGLN